MAQLKLPALDKNKPIAMPGTGLPTIAFSRDWQNVTFGQKKLGDSMVNMEAFVDEVSAKFLLTVGASDHIATIEAFAGPTLSYLLFRADMIAFTNAADDPDQGAEIYPFYIEDGIVHAEHLMVGLLEFETVGDGHIIPGTVSGMLTDSESTPMSVSGAPGSGGTHYTGSYTCRGGKVQVSVGCDIGTAAAAAVGTVATLYCDGVPLRSAGIRGEGPWGSLGRDFTVGHEPGPGAHTYTVDYFTPSGGTSAAYDVNVTDLTYVELVV